MLILAMALFVPGCRKAKAPAPEAETPSAKEVSLTGPQGAGAGVMATMPAVGRVVTMNELQQFAVAYRAQADVGKPPQNLEAMTGFDREAPKICEAIKNGDLIIYWGADPNKAPEGASNTILAHAKKAAIRGGPIPCAFLDGSVRNLQQFEIDKASKGK